MTPWRRRPTAFITALAALLLLSSSAAADQWEENKGNCEHLFVQYQGADLADLKQCLMMWETYKPTEELTIDDKRLVGPFLDFLYHSGDEEARYYAQLSMDRMGIQPSAGGAAVKTKKSQHSERVKRKEKPKRKKWNPREASKGNQRQAGKLIKRGLREHKKGRYQRALKFYRQAVDKDGRSEDALYNGACAYALENDKPNAIEWLRRLLDLGTEKSKKKIRKARKDRDFDLIRDDPEFKGAVGFARVKVVNGLSEYGEDEVERIVKTLQELGYETEDGGPDKHDRAYPIVWYKEHVTHVAYVVEKAVAHPRTKFQAIDWDSEFDIIVSWGDVIKKNQFGEPIVKSYGPSDPDEAEKNMDDLLWEQDKAMREPDKATRKVERTAKTPQRTQMRVESGARRVQDSIDRAGSALDAAGSLF